MSSPKKRINRFPALHRQAVLLILTLVLSSGLVTETDAEHIRSELGGRGSARAHGNAWTLFKGAALSPPSAPLANDVARKDILGVGAVWAELGLFGLGQVVAVADTGLDTGSTGTLSQDFAGRLLEAFALGRAGDWSDPNGHGTHVVGSVLGSGRLSGSDPETHQYGDSFSGVAPEASLVFQSLLDAEDGLGGLPDNLRDLLQQAYDAGARVHTNSWGANFFLKPLARFLTAGRYTLEAAQVDGFVWDHPDMVVLFAAGNDGVDYFSAPGPEGIEFPPPDGVVDSSSLASPGTAKNVITVGASESIRSEGGHAQDTWGNDEDLLSAVMGYSYTMDPIASDLPSDNAKGMAPFSSRGPTNDGRIKPDVVAPGTNIVSSRSHAPGAGDLFGPYDNDYVYCSGTSMATPLVAGVVTLIRQWYVEIKGVASPSAALIKATLINGATDISPGQFGAGAKRDVPAAWPNSVTGWGRVNLQASISPGVGREVWSHDERTGLSTGQEAVFLRSASEGNEPLRVTLVWMDPPGQVEPESFSVPGFTERPPSVLVNDLDLVVETPDGRRILGNMGESPDRLNNVEAVRVVSPPAGEYRIVVRGNQVPSGPQPFALVVAGQHVATSPETEVDVPPATEAVESPTPVDAMSPATPPSAASAAPDDGPGLVEATTTPLPPGMVGEDQQVSSDTGGAQDWLLPVGAAVGILVVATIAGLILARRTVASSASVAPGRARRGWAAGAAAGGAQRGMVSGSASAASLHAKEGPLAGRTFAVQSSPFSVGRDETNDLALPEAGVSRRHAQLTLRGRRWYLEDLGSTNGTLLNRQPLESAQPLHSGDLVFAGESILGFSVHDDGRVAKEAPPGRRRGAFVAVLVAVVLVLLVVGVAAVILLGAKGDRDAGGNLLPGLPPIELPTVNLPTVDLPTIDLPTIQVPTGLPSGVPTVGIPTALPFPTDGLPLPPGGLPIPTISLPSAKEVSP